MSKLFLRVIGQFSVLVALVLSPLSSSGAVLSFDPGTGKLIGAQKILVQGGLFDVTFRDGSCVSIFNGCDKPENFVFAGANPFDETRALAASAALLGQVFTPGSELDATPSLTFGCADRFYCAIFTPYGIYPESAWLGDPISAVAINILTGGSPDSTGFGSVRSAFDDVSTYPSVVYAVWTASPVPEPSTWPLFISAGLMLFIVLRQRGL